jgi:exodeoxyribonuclease VII small subunit
MPSEPSEPSEPTDPNAHLDDLGYAEAVDELEEILAELDGDDVDVDVLAERVKRAADLVQLCRRRLDAARVEVTRIVADLEAVAPVVTDDEPDSLGEGAGLFASEA